MGTHSSVRGFLLSRETAYVYVRNGRMSGSGQYAVMRTRLIFFPEMIKDWIKYVQPLFKISKFPLIKKNKEKNINVKRKKKSTRSLAAAEGTQFHVPVWLHFFFPVSGSSGFQLLPLPVCRLLYLCMCPRLRQVLSVCWSPYLLV